MAAPQTPAPAAPLGVVIVSYGAADFIADCLESLMATGHPNLHVAVVDNASPDDTVAVIEGWASGAHPYARPDDMPLGPMAPVAKPLTLHRRDPQATEPLPKGLSLIHSGGNLGFAGGVNVGLRACMATPGLDHFWILNPDTVVEPQTPFAFSEAATRMGRFGVLGGRALFYDDPGQIHADTGRLHRLFGTAISVNRGAPAASTPMPPADSTDFIPGISMLASRAFVETAGYMEEGYFLYFEEIDWQLRRGDLPFGLVPEARVLHRAGAAIGSGNLQRRANPFSIYFTTRNLLPFVARWQPWKLPFAYLFAWVRLARQWGLGREQILAVVRGLHRLPPPEAVRRRLPQSVWDRIL